jgi:hypothetical protein
LINRMIFGEEFCYAVFSTPLLPHPSWPQISSSAPYSRKPSAYIPPSLGIGLTFGTTQAIEVFWYEDKFKPKQ